MGQTNPGQFTEPPPLTAAEQQRIATLERLLLPSETYGQAHSSDSRKHFNLLHWLAFVGGSPKAKDDLLPKVVCDQDTPY